MRLSSDPEENLTFNLIRRDIMRRNQCVTYVCADLRGENCVCWQDFQAAIARPAQVGRNPEGGDGLSGSVHEHAVGPEGADAPTLGNLDSPSSGGGV